VDERDVVDNMENMERCAECDTEKNMAETTTIPTRFWPISPATRA